MPGGGEDGEAPLGTTAADGVQALDGAWRAAAHTLQEQAMPRGHVLVTCPAPLGTGGLGRHLAELLAALERGAQPATSLCTSSPELPDARLSQRLLSAAVAPLGRTSRAWRMWAGSVAFDARAAAAIGSGSGGSDSGAGSRASGHLIAFNGSAHAQFDVARKADWRSLQLVSANSHFRRVISRHELAHSQYPVERPWVTHLLRRNLLEYEQADRILVSSDYIRDSFLEQGIDEQRLRRFPLTPDPRYTPEARAEESSTFEIVYVGSLTVHKGVPLLLDAVRRIERDDLRLVLVGGWGTRGMRQHVERACAEDPRVSVAPGDPLPHLRRAHLCVHPAYEDGFGYAPAEALAAGVPVIVSADTGMKELIRPGRTGVVIPTGDLDALVEAIEAAYAGRLLDG